MPTVNGKHSIIIKSYFTIHIIVHCYGIINRILYGYIVYFGLLFLWMSGKGNVLV
jgi:hypothetical protein